MKKLRLLNFTIPILLTLFPCFALASEPLPTWHTSKLQNIYQQSEGNVVVLIFENNSNNCFREDGVTPRTYHYIKVGQNNVDALGFKNMYAIALTAFALDKPVTVNFDRNSTGCFINRMAIDKG